MTTNDHIAQTRSARERFLEIAAENTTEAQRLAMHFLFIESNDAGDDDIKREAAIVWQSKVWQARKEILMNGLINDEKSLLHHVRALATYCAGDSVSQCVNLNGAFSLLSRLNLSGCPVGEIDEGGVAFTHMARFLGWQGSTTGLMPHRTWMELCAFLFCYGGHDAYAALLSAMDAYMCTCVVAGKHRAMFEALRRDEIIM